MSTTQQPEALRLADALAYCDASVASQAAAELRRLHAENTTLQAGYAAARLEIESLRAGGAGPAGARTPQDYAPESDRASHGQAHPTVDDLCARIKAADDAAADSDYMLDSNDCIAVLRGEWKAPLAMDKPERPPHGQAPAQAAPAMREAVANAIYDQWVYKDGWVAWVNGGNSLRQDDARRLADLAFAMAQAAPAAVAGPSISQVTEQMRAAGDHAWMTSDGVDSARVFWAMLAAAPTTQPAPHPVDEFQPCPSCFGTGVEGDADDYGRTIDVTCGECNGSGRAKATTKAAPQQEAQEPVAWQSRTRPTWGGDNRPWSPWEPCTKGQAEDCWKTPLLHDWAYEARALYAAPRQEAQEPCPSCRNSDIYACTCTFPKSRNTAPQPSPVAQGCALDVVLDAFENKTRGIPQAHIAAALVAELRAAIEAASTTPTAQVDALESEYQRGYRQGYEQRDAEVRGALV